MGATQDDGRSITFNNQTDRTWTMAVYQTLPNSKGLDSVSWKQVTGPQQRDAHGLDRRLLVQDKPHLCRRCLNKKEFSRPGLRERLQG